MIILTHAHNIVNILTQYEQLLYMLVQTYSQK